MIKRDARLLRHVRPSFFPAKVSSGGQCRIGCLSID
nr:MAG TPA: hypothetical protein [Caudoviricetes sp.]